MLIICTQNVYIVLCRVHVDYNSVYIGAYILLVGVDQLFGALLHMSIDLGQPV